mmetsp:Transcript_47550/g.153147  ORF Transcript_47550/g.153147 Transcript_47550/m.153147 type:complete len:313 (+) Transcript_47550:335-1273(+)
MVRHLCVRKPPLRRMGKVGGAAHARMLLERLHDAEKTRDHKEGPVDRKQDLRGNLAHDGVAEVVEPVVLVRVAGERMPRPVVNHVDAPPEKRHDVERAVGPVHAKGEEVVVGHKTGQPDRNRCASQPRVEGGVEARHSVVQCQDERELREERHAVVVDEGGELLAVATAQIALRLECVLARRLRPPRRTGEEDGLEVCIVDAPRERRSPQEGGELTEPHRPRHVDSGRREQRRHCGERQQDRQLDGGVQPVGRQQERREVRAPWKFLHWLAERVDRRRGRRGGRLLDNARHDGGRGARDGFRHVRGSYNTWR